MNRISAPADMAGTNSSEIGLDLFPSKCGD
jgi:hypothetical protein